MWRRSDASVRRLRVQDTNIGSHNNLRTSGVPLSPSRRVDPDTVAFLLAAGCVYAEDEARILTESAGSADELRSFLDRRASGEPLEYVVGWAEFCGLRISLSSGVFVPRRRSEFLAECVVQAALSAAIRTGDAARRVKVLDMCCGSGAIGLAVASRVREVELLAADCSPIAVECARENLAAVGGRVYQGDLSTDTSNRVAQPGCDRRERALRTDR